VGGPAGPVVRSVSLASGWEAAQTGCTTGRSEILGQAGQQQHEQGVSKNQKVR